MKDFTISSDLSITNTKLSIDGKEITKKEKVVGINFYASSPSKDDCECNGYVDLSVTTVDDEGNVETKDYRKSEYMSKKLPMGQIIKDYLEKIESNDFVRYIGSDVDTEVKELADKIINHCKDKELNCPDSDVLYSRTKQSLTDKAVDLGITTDVEDNSDSDGNTEDNSDNPESSEENEGKK